MFLFNYIESQKITKQGKREEIYRKYYPEWCIRELGGGNGNWLLTKHSDIIVNGRSCREFVLDYYNKQLLTKNLADKFCQDIENGNIQLQDIDNYYNSFNNF